MKDSIEKEDLLVGVDKTELEKEIATLRDENSIQQDKIEGLATEAKKIWKLIEKQHAMNKILLQAVNKDPELRERVKKNLRELAVV